MVDTKGDIRVFVYGSLKKGKGLHGLLSKANFITREYIEEEMQLCDMGPFPALVKEPTQTFRTYGEVYVVDQETLAALDMAEGHPTFFKRHKVKTAKNGYRVWVYVLSDEAEQYAGDALDKDVWKPSKTEQEYINAQC